MSSPSRARRKWGASSSTRRRLQPQAGRARARWQEPAGRHGRRPGPRRIAEQVANAIFWNMGENCSAGSPADRPSRASRTPCSRSSSRRRATWIVGDPLDPATRIGPMITDGHLQRVLAYIETGVAEGARIAVGGRRVLEETGGHFVEPTIFDGAPTTCASPRRRSSARSCDHRVRDRGRGDRHGQRHAVRPGGLDLHGERARAHRMARAIKAGTVGINAYSEGDMTHAVRRVQAVGFRRATTSRSTPTTSTPSSRRSGSSCPAGRPSMADAHAAEARNGMAAAIGAAIVYGAAYPATAVALRSFSPLAVAGLACRSRSSSSSASRPAASSPDRS